MRAEMESLKIAAATGAAGMIANGSGGGGGGGGGSLHTDVAVALYDAAVASGELAAPSGGGGGVGGGGGGMLLEQARARADGIVAEAEAMAARLMAEAENARGGWHAQVKEAAAEMYRAAAGGEASTGSLVRLFIRDCLLIEYPLHNWW